jgi:hypothetical protein
VADLLVDTGELDLKLGRTPGETDDRAEDKIGADPEAMLVQNERSGLMASQEGQD